MTLKLPNIPLLDIGAGQPMILLSGLLGSIDTWNFCVKEFSKKYRVLIPRLPFTSYPFSQSRMNELVDYMEEFVDTHVGSERIVIIGIFRGGCIATLYALRHPGRVDKLVLSGSEPLFEHAFPPMHCLPRQPVQWPINSSFSNMEARHADDTAIELSESTWSDVNKAFQRNASRHVVPTDNALNALLVWGKNDKRSSPSVAWQYCEFIGNPEIIFIEDCGHAPITEQPNIFNRIVGDYLG